jgi:hypothetical protein
MKTLKLTDRELSLLMTAVATHIIEVGKTRMLIRSPELADRINELTALEDDLREMLHRDDGWTTRVNPHVAQAIDNDAMPTADEVVEDFIQMGIDAREMKKERAIQAFGDSDMRLGSMAAQRRAAERSIQRMMQGTATPVIVEEDE